MTGAGWSVQEGAAVLLPMDGIDTDQLIPARFMSRPRSAGYGAYLLHDLRHMADGTPDPDCVLNWSDSADARFLLAGREFGSGSSREAAVYALVDFGIRAVIAPSFGDIFASNAVNNGLCPARVTPEDWSRLADALEQGPARLTVDLTTCEIRGAGAVIPFEIDPVWRQKLIEGWDDIDLTQAHADAIAGFRARDAVDRPWALPHLRQVGRPDDRKSRPQSG